MEIKWKNKVPKDIGLAYVTDNDTEILNFIGYHHVGEKRTFVVNEASCFVLDESDAALS